MVESYQKRRAQELSMPTEGIGKRYNTEELMQFVEVAEAYTAEVFMHTWHNIWKAWGKILDVKVVVPECDRTPEEVQVLESRGRMLIYLPPLLSTAENLPQLQGLIPAQDQSSRGWVDAGRSRIINHYEQHGWLSVESAHQLYEEPKSKAWLSSPFHSMHEDLRSIQEQIQKLQEAALYRKSGLESGKLVGQTINTYILGSLFSKLLTGKYFDQHEREHPSLLFGSAIQDNPNDPNDYIPYGREGVIWSYCGPIDYHLARTVELKVPIEPSKILTPRQLFHSIGAYKKVSL